MHGILVILVFDACPRGGAQVFAKCIEASVILKFPNILEYTFEKVCPFSSVPKLRSRKIEMLILP